MKIKDLFFLTTGFLTNSPIFWRTSENRLCMVHERGRKYVNSDGIDQGNDHCSHRHFKDTIQIGLLMAGVFNLFQVAQPFKIMETKKPKDDTET
jgi:hypothetical protein